MYVCVCCSIQTSLSAFIDSPASRSKLCTFCVVAVSMPMVTGVFSVIPCRDWVGSFTRYVQS